MPWTFSDSHELGPETYTYTAKRYTFTYTMMGRVRVRGSADLSDHCRNRNRNRNRDRNRNRSLPFMAPGLHGPLRLDCRVVYPVSHVRIPSPVPSIPIPIATPTPSLLRHVPFRIATSYIPPSSSTNTCVLCDLCGSPPHPDPQIFRYWRREFSDGLWLL
ncbi:MAG: hypothetical protein ACOX52_00410 [Verrucomicrobiota bacterium]